MRSRRLTDMIDLDRQLFNERVADGDLFTQLSVGEHHLFECVTEHGPAFFDVFPLCHDLRPFYDLSHIPGADLGIFCRVADHSGPPERHCLAIVETF